MKLAKYIIKKINLLPPPIAITIQLVVGFVVWLAAVVMSPVDLSGRSPANAAGKASTSGCAMIRAIESIIHPKETQKTNK